MIDKNYYRQSFEDIMNKNNWTQEQLADDIGVSIASIKRMKGTLGDENWNPSEKILSLVDNYIKNSCKKEVVVEKVNADTSNLHLENKELKSEILKLSKSLQKQLDHNRVLRKKQREMNRGYIANEDLFKEVLNQIPILEKVHKPQLQEINKKTKSLIIQLADIHINQRFEMRENSYSIEIARQRLMEYAKRAIEVIDVYDISDVFIVNTGDNFQLTDRADQLICSEVNRSQALLKALDVFEEFLMKFVGYKRQLNLKLASVIGNESRVNQSEYASSCEDIATDSFDYLLHNLLKRRFQNNIEFLNDCQYLSDAIEINDKFMLAFTHGDKLKHTEQEIISLGYNLAKHKQRIPDYTILGHIHSSLVSANFSRSGSLVSENSYSVNQLNIPGSKASQHLYIVEDNVIMPIVIFLT